MGTPVSGFCGARLANATRLLSRLSGIDTWASLLAAGAGLAAMLAGVYKDSLAASPVASRVEASLDTSNVVATLVGVCNLDG
jgi:hypothetical protein